MRQWLKLNSISLIFMLVIGMLAISIVLSTAKSTGLCYSDPNFTICLRNWVNAAGNIAAAFIAVLALVLSWRQLRSNAAMAALPVVTQRITTIRTVTLVINSVRIHTEMLADEFSDVARDIESDNRELNLYIPSINIIDRWNKMFSELKEIKNFTGDIVDNDLEEQITIIIDTTVSMREEIRSVVNLFKERSEVEKREDNIENFYDNTSMANLMIRSSLSRIQQSESLCREKLQEMNIVVNALLTILGQAKVSRAKLLRSF